MRIFRWTYAYFLTYLTPAPFLWRGSRLNRLGNVGLLRQCMVNSNVFDGGQISEHVRHATKVQKKRYEGTKIRYEGTKILLRKLDVSAFVW